MTDELSEETERAMVDLYARRFRFSMGDRNALAPHEIEGYVTELRNSLPLLDEIVANHPERAAFRDEVRRKLELYEELA